MRMGMEDGSGDRNRGQQVQLGSSRLWEYAARSHFSLAASLCNSNISSSNIDIDDISDRRMSLSSSVCCPVFFFCLPLFGTTHFNDESSGVAVPPIHYEFRL